MKRNTRAFELNDLPKFSNWPKILLGFEKSNVKIKDKKNIIREYGQDKWGKLLHIIEKLSHVPTIEDVDRIFVSNEYQLFYHDSKLKKLKAQTGHRILYKLIKSEIMKFLPSSSIVELGAGYGTIILKLAKDNYVRQNNYLAAELTDSGIDLLKKIALGYNKTININYCDLTNLDLSVLPIKENAIIFTSFSLAYVPVINENFVNKFRAIKPKVVIHFEPIYEHCDTTTLLGLLNKKYIEENGYNKNLLSILKRQQQKGQIKIIKELPNIFGINPICYKSIIAWKFNGN